MLAAMGLARISGALYLAASVLVIAAGSVKPRLSASDPAATIEHVRASEGMFRIAIATDVVSATLFLLTAMAFFVLFADVDRRAGAATVVFSALGTALWWVALANELSLLSLATDERSAALGVDATRTLASLLVQGYRSAMLMTELTSGLWLFPLGYLVMRAAPFPRVIGQLLVIGGVCWVAMFFMHVLAPSLSTAASYLALGSISEIALIGWLLFKGADAVVPRSPRPA